MVNLFNYDWKHFILYFRIQLTEEKKRTNEQTKDELILYIFFFLFMIHTLF